MGCLHSQAEPCDGGGGDPPAELALIGQTYRVVGEHHVGIYRLGAGSDVVFKHGVGMDVLSHGTDRAGF